MLTEPLLCSEVMNWNAALLAETDNEKTKKHKFVLKVSQFALFTQALQVPTFHSHLHCLQHYNPHPTNHNS
jgi:hypothetical protein